MWIKYLIISIIIAVVALAINMLLGQEFSGKLLLNSTLVGGATYLTLFCADYIATYNNPGRGQGRGMGLGNKYGSYPNVMSVSTETGF